jgi:hypothetical protein
MIDAGGGVPLAIAEAGNKPGKERFIVHPLLCPGGGTADSQEEQGAKPGNVPGEKGGGHTHQVVLPAAGSETA